MEKKPSEVLECAAELLSDPQHWTYGTYSRQKYNSSTGKYETSYCMLGAIFQCANNSPYINAGTGRVVTLLSAFLPQRAHGSIAIYNDNPRTTHSAVVKTLKKAAKFAREQGE